MMGIAAWRLNPSYGFVLRSLRNFALFVKKILYRE
jgi:hypothetical protein